MSAAAVGFATNGTARSVRDVIRQTPLWRAEAIEDVRGDSLRGGVRVCVETTAVAVVVAVVEAPRPLDRSGGEHGGAARGGVQDRVVVDVRRVPVGGGHERVPDGMS